MDLRIGAARKLAHALFGWFGGAKANAATEGQSTTSTNVFPQSVEVIPGRLKVRIFLHEIDYENQKLSCWSYLTDGLVAQKQKEIIFTLRRDPGQKPEDYPSELLELFATIFHYAERGQLVDVGQSTLFGETGLFGYRDFRGIGYVEPQGFPGVETKDVPLLAGILLKDDEAQIAWDLGLTRVTALLGMKYRYYHCPTWSDLKREPAHPCARWKKASSEISQEFTFVRAITKNRTTSSFLYYQPAGHALTNSLASYLRPNRWLFGLNLIPVPMHV